ncbi:Uncharacterised protein [Streptococcus suis]|nr:Uncharacterised protein [Streptococcus suis]
MPASIAKLRHLIAILSLNPQPHTYQGGLVATFVHLLNTDWRIGAVFDSEANGSINCVTHFYHSGWGIQYTDLTIVRNDNLEVSQWIIIDWRLQLFESIGTRS